MDVISVLVAGAFVAMLVAGVVGASKQTKTIASVWATVAAQIGLKYLPTGKGRLGGDYTGVIGKLRVTMEVGSQGSGPDWTIVRVSSGGIPGGLSAEKRSLWAAPLGSARSGVLSGDEAFDDELLIKGGPDVQALLDFATRRALRQFVMVSGGKITNGVITLERPTLVDKPDELRRMIESATAIAQAFAASGDRAARLAAIATADPSRKCRMRAFETLLELHGDAPEVGPTVRAALGRGFRPQMRLLAALRCDDAEGTATLQELTARGSEVAIEAYEALVLRGRTDLETRMIALLARDDEAWQAQVAEALGRCGSVSAVEPLLACAEQTSTFGGRAVRNAVQAAVARIQSRLSDAEGGRLSMVTQAGAGAVSVAGRSEGGAVTVAGASDAGAVRLASVADALREPE